MATGQVISSGSFVIEKEQKVPYVKSNIESKVALQQSEPKAIEKVQSTNTTGTQDKVPVVNKANDKTAYDSVGDEGGQINEEFEFREEAGGYEDDEEDNFESMEDENGPTEMDEEGGYKDEDEEFEDC